MPYKDKDKAREYTREAMRRHRMGITGKEDNVIPNVIPTKSLRAYSKVDQTGIKMTKAQAQKTQTFQELKTKFDYRLA